MKPKPKKKRKKPTAKNLNTLSIGENRDPSLPGFLVRVTPQRTRHFEIRYSFAGKQHRASLGDSRQIDFTKARGMARDLLAGAKHGVDPRDQIRRNKGLTISGLGEAFFEWAEETKAFRPATMIERKRIWASDILPALGNLEAPHLSRAQIRAWGAARAKSSGYSANRAHQLLRAVFAWGVRRDIINATPFAMLELPFSGEVTRERYLSRQEVGALQRALGDLPCGFSDAVSLLLLTGVRRSSVMMSRTAEFNEAQALWSIPGARMKSGRPHDVPLSRQALEIYRSQVERAGPGMLFPPMRSDSSQESRPVGTRYVRRLKARMGERLGSTPEPWTLHDLRRTIATHAEEIGIRREVVAAILGHAMGSAQTRIYARSELLKERREALQAWANWCDLAHGLPRSNVSGFWETL